MPSALRQLARRVLPVSVRVALTQGPAMVALLKVPALERTAKPLPHLACERQTPLRRAAIPYDERLQRAKERNVSRAAELLDGLSLPPGALFSWHRQLGPPLTLRGFAPGPELHEDTLEAGTGGGLCQVSNLLFWLALHAGFTIVERHRHALDLFPDDSRTTPFGCGATVFFPKKDLRFVNSTGVEARLTLGVRAGFLLGQLHTRAPLPFRCELVESSHRFTRRAGVVWRENSVARRWHFPDGSTRDEWIAEHAAEVRYNVDPTLIT
ncbi:MAG: VanW family protein [Myxococcota bacterium]